jgi:GNAT superfamily N-acetyltransferase
MWMRASLAKDMADVVFVTRDKEGEIAGIGAGRIDADGIGVPTLMAVDKKMTGQGLGRSFVLSCMSWLKQRGVKTARITTQSKNKLACNCYKRMGWQLVDRQDIHHIWLKPPTIKAQYL